MKLQIEIVLFRNQCCATPCSVKPRCLEVLDFIVLHCIVYKVSLGRMKLEIKQSFCATANLTMQNCSVKIGQSQLNADTGKGNRMSRKKDINFFLLQLWKNDHLQRKLWSLSIYLGPMIWLTFWWFVIKLWWSIFADVSRRS